MKTNYIVNLVNSYYMNHPDREKLFNNKEKAMNYALNMSKISLVHISIDNNLIACLDNRQ